MDSVLQTFTDWVSMLHPSVIVLLISLVAYLENVIPPIPGDLVVVFAGVLASEGIIRIAPVYIGTTFASVVGFMSMYYLAVYLSSGHERANERSSRLSKLLNPVHLRRARMWMGRWGQWVVFGNRFLAGTRSVIALTAGFSRTPVALTSMNSLFSSLLWNAVLLLLGFMINENLETIGRYLSIYSRSIAVLLVVAVAGFWWMRRRRRLRKAQRRGDTGG